jgi:hypothetical protein
LQTAVSTSQRSTPLLLPSPPHYISLLHLLRPYLLYFNNPTYTHFLPTKLFNRCGRYGEAKPPAEQGIDECVSRILLQRKSCNMRGRYQEGITGKAPPRRGPHYVQDPQVLLDDALKVCVFFLCIHCTFTPIRASARVKLLSLALQMSSNVKCAEV